MVRHGTTIHTGHDKRSGTTGTCENIGRYRPAATGIPQDVAFHCLHLISRHAGTGNHCRRINRHLHYRQMVLQRIYHADIMYQRSFCPHCQPLPATYHQQRKVTHLYVEHHNPRHDPAHRRSSGTFLRNICHACHVCLDQYTMATEVASLRAA